MERCKQIVFKGFHLYRCSRNAVMDGYCKQHHPDNVKARDIAAQKRYDEQKKKSAWYLLKEEVEKTKRLESEIEMLKAELSSLRFRQEEL